MKILALHNQYRIRGGEDESHDLEVALLRAQGAEVFDYIEDNRNLPGEFPLRAGISVFWNQSTYRKVRQLIRQHRFDVMKVDNLFPIISGAALQAAADEELPVVQTIRNFRAVCPGAVLYRDGKVCTECVGRTIAWPGIKHKCYRSSAVQTALVTLSSAFQTKVLKTTEKVDAYIAATQFMRRHLIDTGTPASQVHVKPNFIVDSGAGNGSGKFLLYVGRLTTEKGVGTLLEAWERQRGDLTLKIVGDGPLSGYVKERAAALSGVEYLGRKPLDEVCALMGKARALLFTSQWYETFGRTIAESYSKGTPVICSRIGAVEELLTDRVHGLFFEAGNAGDLAEKIEWADSHPEEMAAMRQAARARYLAEFTPAQNYRRMMEIFEAAILHKRSTARNAAPGAFRLSPPNP